MNKQRLIALGVAGLLFIVMALSVANTAAWQETGADGVESIDEIVQDLFTDHLVTFEVLGVLLTAAMIGALVIARPMVGGLDKDHYKPADQAQLERSQRVSEVGATFTVVPLEPRPAPLKEDSEE